MSKATEQAEMPKAAERAKMPKQAVIKKKGRLSSPRVILLGAAILLFCTVGFYALPGMIDENATGSHLVNSLCCAVMTLTT
jgi:thiazole synthase ThiGH ThiG subunit